MSKVTPDQLKRTLKSLTRNERFSTCRNFEDILELLLTGCETFRAPFYVNDVSVSEERLMLYNHKMYASKSLLCEQLAARYKEVILMVDDVLPSKEALHFVTLTDSSGVIRDWLSMMRKFNFMVREVSYDQDDTRDYIIMSPLTSFLNAENT